MLGIIYCLTSIWYDVSGVGSASVFKCQLSCYFSISGDNCYQTRHRLCSIVTRGFIYSVLQLFACSFNLKWLTNGSSSGLRGGSQLYSALRCYLHPHGGENVSCTFLSGFWCHMVLKVITNVLMEHTASTPLKMEAVIPSETLVTVPTLKILIIRTRSKWCVFWNSWTSH